jgi:hypothetical protein
VGIGQVGVGQVGQVGNCPNVDVSTSECPDVELSTSASTPDAGVSMSECSCPDVDVSTSECPDVDVSTSEPVCNILKGFLFLKFFYRSASGTRPQFESRQGSSACL